MVETSNDDHMLYVTFNQDSSFFAVGTEDFEFTIPTHSETILSEVIYVNLRFRRRHRYNRNAEHVK
jgi:hypothetical protein